MIGSGYHIIILFIDLFRLVVMAIRCALHRHVVVDDWADADIKLATQRRTELIIWIKTTT